MSHSLWNQIAGGALNDEQVGQLDRYLELLIEKNQHLNLTRILGLEEAQVGHVADALTVLPHLPASRVSGGLKLADVGTGGGIPGAIIAIARPDIDVTLIDSTAKKLDAVGEICQQVGLKNVRTVHARMEAVDQNFHIVTARAVAEMDKLLTWCSRLLKHNGRLIAMKGPKLSEELARLSPRNRRQWKIDIHPVSEVPQLAGHQLVIAKQSQP